MSEKTIGIIGAGAWGTALAQCFESAGRRVMIWVRDDDTVTFINTKHESPAHPGIPLAPTLRATSDMNDLNGADVWLYVLPAQALREFLKDHTPPVNKPFVIAAKGIEIETGMLLSHVADDVCGARDVTVLTGPNFASEIVRGLPAATTLAGKNAAALQDMFATPRLRVYPTPDIIGAQVGGAVKNVMAIACGVVEGLKLGDNARAALITRGLAEMTRLAVALGGQRETLMGLSGIGDLILTCTSTQSRNYRFGLQLADGSDHGLASGATVEGVHTARAVANLAARLDVDMPITEVVAACLTGAMTTAQAAETLLQRPPRAWEHE